MKKILSLFVLLSSFCFAEQAEESEEKEVFDNRPIWEQDLHFQKYMWTMVSCAAIRIQDKLSVCNESQISDELKELILNDINIILFNVGL